MNKAKLNILSLKFWAVLLFLSSITILMLSSTGKPDVTFSGITEPILIFEFAQSVSEMQSFLEAIGEEYLKQLDIVNWFDFVFMTAYSMFIAVWSIFFSKNVSSAFKYLLVLAAMMFVCDVAENIVLFQISSQYKNSVPISELYIVYLQIFTWIKWLSIATALAAFSAYFFLQKGIKKMIGILFILPIILGIWAILDKSAVNQLFSNAITLDFIFLIIFAFFVKKPNKTNDLHTA